MQKAKVASVGSELSNSPMASDAPPKTHNEIHDSADKKANDASSAKFSDESSKLQKAGDTKPPVATTKQPDTTSQHLPADFAITNGEKGAHEEKRSTFGEFMHQSELFGKGLVSGSIGNAINGVKQIYDHAEGIEYKPTQLFDNQAEVDKSLAGKIGSGIGAVADFVAVTAATGGVAGAVGLAGIGGTALAVGAAGAIEGGLLRPSDDKNFAEGRLINAGIGAAAGAVGFGASLGVNALVEGVGAGAIGSAALRVGGGIGTGAAIGAGATEVAALATTGSNATPEQLGLGAGFGAVGGGLGAVRFGARNGGKPAENSDGPEGDHSPKPDGGPKGGSADANLIDGMKNGAVKFAEKSLDKEARNAVSATVDVDGHPQQVLIKGEHNPLAPVADKFHQLTDFTSTIPKTTTRSVESLGPDGAKNFEGKTSVDVQERVGKLLSDLQDDGTVKDTDAQIVDRVDAMSKGKTNDQFAQQIEQAVAERTIIGDNDMIDFNNITMSKENGNWKAGNIDLTSEHDAFGTEHTPMGVSPLSGKEISAKTLDKIGALVNKLETPAGRQSLTDIGLNNEQADALIARAKSLQTNKKFPEPTGYDFD